MSALSRCLSSSLLLLLAACAATPQAPPPARSVAAPARTAAPAKPAAGPARTLAVNASPAVPPSAPVAPQAGTDNGPIVMGAPLPAPRPLAPAPQVADAQTQPREAMDPALFPPAAPPAATPGLPDQPPLTVPAVPAPSPSGPEAFVPAKSLFNAPEVALPAGPAAQAATAPTVGTAPPTAPAAPAVPVPPTGGTAAAPMADTPAQGMTPSGPPRGVAGIAWGSPAKSVPGLVAHEAEPSLSVITYTWPAGPHDIVGAPIRDVFFEFYQDRFYHAWIDLDGKAAYQTALAGLIAAYGPPTNEIPEKFYHAWTLGDVNVYCAFHPVENEGDVSYFYQPIYDRLTAVRKAAQAKAKPRRSKS